MAYDPRHHVAAVTRGIETTVTQPDGTKTKLRVLPIGDDVDWLARKADALLDVRLERGRKVRSSIERERVVEGEGAQDDSALAKLAETIKRQADEKLVQRLEEVPFDLRLAHLAPLYAERLVDWDPKAWGGLEPPPGPEASDEDRAAGLERARVMVAVPFVLFAVFQAAGRDPSAEEIEAAAKNSEGRSAGASATGRRGKKPSAKSKRPKRPTANKSTAPEDSTAPSASG